MDGSLSGPEREGKPYGGRAVLVVVLVVMMMVMVVIVIVVVVVVVVVVGIFLRSLPPTVTKMYGCTHLGY